MKRGGFLLVFLISLFATHTIFAEVQIIEFIEISPPSPQHAYGYGLDNDGRVVGLVKNGFINSAFIWDETTGLALIDLPHEASASDLNDQGTVVGSAIIKNSTTSYSYSPYRYKSDGSSFFLGFSAEAASAASINSTGNIAGFYDRIGAVLWTSTGGIHFLDLGQGKSRAYDINDRDQIVGYYEKDVSGTSLYMAFLLDGIEGDLTDLGSLGTDTHSYARALNENGCVAGYAENDSNEYHAFFWAAGNMYDLGTLGGPYSEAKDISNRNIVVGYSEDINEHTHAFVWDPKHKMIDLNDLMPQDTRIYLISAFAINRHNQVAGYGLMDGRYRAFRMTLDGLVSSTADLDIDSDVDGRDMALYLEALTGATGIPDIDVLASDFGKIL